MGRLIGEAYIALRPDADMFRPEADAALKKAMAGMRAEIPIEGNLKGVRKKIAELAAALKGLNGEVKIDKRSAITDLAVLTVAVEKLRDRLKNMPVDMDDSKSLAKLYGLISTAGNLQKQIKNLGSADFDIQKALSKFYTLEAAAKTLESSISKTIEVSMRAEPPVPFTGSVYGPKGVQLRSSPAEGRLQSMAFGLEEIAAKAYAARDADLAFLAATYKLDTGTRRVAEGLRFFGNTESMIIASNAGGWWGGMATKIRLFGGALDHILPSWARAISLWHLGVDVILEFAAAWAPALIAAGTFAAYAIPVGKKIYSQWSNINTILDGVGGKLPDLGRSFDTIQKAIEPSILSAFGMYMMVIGRNAQPMGDALAKVGAVIDGWMAGFVGWFNKAQKAFIGFINVGAKDMAAIGYGFQQVFRIIGSLFHDFPGYVHVLLALGDAFLHVTANIVQFLSPVIKAGLFIHGFMIYAGLAVTAVVALGRAMLMSGVTTFMTKTGRLTGDAAVAAEGATGKFSKFGAAIGAFGGLLAAGAVNTWNYGRGLFTVGENAEKAGLKSKIASGGVKLFKDGLKLVTMVPLAGWAAIAAAAIGVGLYFALRNTASAADQFAAAMQSKIASSNIINIQKNIADAVAQTSGAIKTQQKLVSTAAGPAPQGGIVGREGMAWAAHFKAAKTNATQYQGVLTQVINTNNTYGMRMAALTKVFGSNRAAQAALNLMGIKAGDIATENNSKWATQYTELQGLANGYGYMGHQAGAAGNQLATLNIASGTTLKNLQALTQAESAWTTMVTSGDTAFVNFEQGQNTLATALGKSSKGAVTFTVNVGKLRERFTATGASMNGTTQAALAARQAFDSQISAGTTLYGNLQTLATASGNTTSAQRSLAKSGRDIIAQLLPMAAGSKQATAEVYSLAQVVGYTGKDSFQALAKWVGNTKGAEADLNTQQAALTISSANLTIAEKNLANVLDTQITSAQAAAISKTVNLTGATQNLATAVNDAHGKVTTQAILYSGEYYNSLVRAGLGTSTATQYLNAYLQRLGYGQGQIHLIDGALHDNQREFEKLANKLGISKQAADDLYTSLHKLSSNSPYNTTVTDKFGGQGVLSATANIPGVAALVSHLNFTSHFARGGVVPAGSGPAGQDSHLAMVAPGELIVPASHAAHFGDMAKRAGIPGFAGGGVVGGAQGLAAQIGNTVPWATQQTTQWAGEVGKAFAHAILNAASNQAMMGGMGGTIPPGAAGNGLLIAKFLMSAGLNAAAAAGVAATIFGESSWSPEAVGSGGFGLIGWTGNTIGLPPGYTGPTGNVARDMAIQLHGVIGYINANGGIGPLNSAGNAIAAGDIFSMKYERPLVALSDTRPAIAQQIYGELLGASASTTAQTGNTIARAGRVRPHSGGGVISEPVLGTGLWSGIPYSFAENGRPEIVASAGQVQGSGHSRMQAQTMYQGQTIINQNNMLIKLLQQMPYAYAQAMNNGASKGAMHGYFGAQF